MVATISCYLLPGQLLLYLCVIVILPILVPALDVCRSGPRGPAVYVRRVYLLDMDRVGVRFFYNFFDNEKKCMQMYKENL